MEQAPILPKKCKITPNKGSGWRTTQGSMGVPVKTINRKHTGTYSGREIDGKKDRADT